MVYVDPKDLGDRPYFERWMTKFGGDKKEQNEVLIESFDQFYRTYIPPLINLIYEGIFEEDITKPLELSI